MKSPRRSFSHASSAVNISWSEAMPAAAKALISGSVRKPAAWPSTTPRAAKVASIIPQSRACDGLSGFHTAGQSITSSSPVTIGFVMNPCCSSCPNQPPPHS